MCAPYYVEFPVDPVVGVNWKTTGEPEPPPPDDPFGSRECGGVYNPYGAGEAAYIVSAFAVYTVDFPIADQPFLGLTGWYNWNRPPRFTAEIRPQIDLGYFAPNDPDDFRQTPDPWPPCDLLLVTVGLTLVRNTDPHIVAQTLKLGGYSPGPTLIEFDPIRPDEAWDPIVVVSTSIDDVFLNPGPGCAGMNFRMIVPILIQAYCGDQNTTYGGPPPFAYTLTPPPPPGTPYAWEGF